MTDKKIDKNIIKIDKLSLIRGYRLLFKNLNFQLNSSEAIHLKGRNGSGKTSLFKVITTQLKPTTGSFLLFGKKTKQLEADDFDDFIYLGHQTSIKSNLTVIENLRLNSQIFDNVEINISKLEFALEQVGLLKFKNQLSGKLSAGQKRRVMLARLWVCGLSKKLWILDEPLTALDIEAIDILQKYIGKHLSNNGAIIFTSHQPLQLKQNIKIVNLNDFT